LFASGVSGLTVENSSANENGNGGMSASNIVNAVFYNNQFNSNNAAQNWITSYDASGLKITGGTGGSSQITVDSNTATNNGGPGLWLDTRWQQIVVMNNYSAFNQNHGIDMESGSNSYVMNNNTSFNQASNAGGIALSKTVGVEVWNNLSQDNYTNIKVTDTCDASVPAASGNEVVNNIVGGGITGDFDQVYIHDYCVCSIGYPQCSNTALNMVSGSGSNPADDWNQYETQLNNSNGYHDAANQLGWDTVSGIPAQYSKLSSFQSAVGSREVNSRQVNCSSVGCPSPMTGAPLPSEIALPLGLIPGNTYGVGQIP
jgi:parallel beta-helix repeat protein